MYIFFEDENLIDEEVLELMAKAGEITLIDQGVDPNRCELSVSFVDEDNIKALNKTYRNIDKVTDVLSFPQFERVEDFPKYGEICLGDVVICNEVAKKQAKTFGHSYKREIIYLFTHSILHLLGYDHMNSEDKSEMRKKEEEIMNSLNITRCEEKL